MHKATCKCSSPGKSAETKQEQIWAVKNIKQEVQEMYLGS